MLIVKLPRICMVNLFDVAQISDKTDITVTARSSTTECKTRRFIQLNFNSSADLEVMP